MNIILPVAKISVNVPGIVGLGFLIGTLSGLFGVGGGFLITPMLNAAFGIPYNFAVGSGLFQMIATSGAASIRHRKYGQVDCKLAILLVLGSIPGAEIGAQILRCLKGLGFINIYGHSFDLMYIWMTIIYILFLVPIGVFMFKEGKSAMKKVKLGEGQDGVIPNKISRKLRSIRVYPSVSCSVSGLEDISLWVPFSIGLVMGILSGLLGVGGGIILVPVLIYFVGIPTKVVVGTSLFQMIFTAGYGGFTHLLKGNVDFFLVIFILAGSLMGSQLGTYLNKRMKRSSLRYYFSWIVFGAIAVLIIKFLWNLRVF